MRGKRSKQYRKLMGQFSMSFGFREPYQVLVDAELVHDSCKMKSDLDASLERTVHGKVKTMITQCEIRKLYLKKNEPGASAAIDVAKTFERRRCGHHPDEYPEPLSTRECLESIVDPKGSGQNKHRYVVASQSQEVRRALRLIEGVPLIYVKRSVMILEPMADQSVQIRARQEKSKFRAELVKNLGKRKRAEEEGSEDGEKVVAEKKEKRKRPGPKGPNPLAVKKSKAGEGKGPKGDRIQEEGEEEGEAEPTKAKRKRRKKGKGVREEAEQLAAEGQDGDADERGLEST